MMSHSNSSELTQMELLPNSTPVYGGGLIVAFISEEYLLSDDVRAFLVFKGSRQRQVTEAKISIPDNALHAVIPDHEPPERVTLGAYLLLPGDRIQCIAVEPFTYYLDQTCYLAKYLADSVHDLRSLEDWDNIRGPNFSLASEDFSSLDERLTSAFQHLILPHDWNLLGDTSTDHEPRETLFHFAARLGLSTFVTLLLEKKGAESCLQLNNLHGELAKDIAEERGFDGLADLITDPHAHGVIKWESKEEVGQAIVLTRHSFGTVSTSAEAKNGHWPSLEIEIEALSRSSAPPATPVPYQVGSEDMWDEVDQNASLPYLDPAYYEDHYPAVSPGDVFSSDYSAYNAREAPDGGRTTRSFLDDNLQRLHDISDDIHYLRRRDMERLQMEEDPEDPGSRLSSSCPDLVQDLVSQSDASDSARDRTPSTPVVPRNRQALPTNMEEEIEAQLRADDYGRDAPLDDPSLHSSNLERRHSFHSAEDLTKPVPRLTRMSVSDGEDDQEQPPVSSPAVVRRGARGNMATFTLVTQADSAGGDADAMNESRRAKSMIVNSNDPSQLDTDGDRRFTISEGVIPESSENREVEEHPPDDVVAPLRNDNARVEHGRRTNVPPPVPPRPPKKPVTRKLSFLEKMRNSSRNKPKEKGKIKTFAEMKFGSNKPLKEVEECSPAENQVPVNLEDETRLASGGP